MAAKNSTQSTKKTTVDVQQPEPVGDATSLSTEQSTAGADDVIDALTNPQPLETKQEQPPVLPVKMNGEPMPDVLPESVTLADPYGFYSDDGAPNFWSAGQVVSHPNDVFTLIERVAPLLPF